MKFKNISYATAIYAALFLFGLFIYLSFQVFVTDSEFWSIALGYHFLDEIKHDWVYGRPLYYFLLWLSQISYVSPTWSVSAARIIFIVNTAVIGWLMLLLSQKRTGTKIYGIIAFVFLLGNTGFMNQGFRVRSDLLTSSLTLAVLVFSRSWILCLLPLLATPKAILGTVALAGRKLFLNRPRYFKIWISAAVAVAALWIFTNLNNLNFIFSSLESHDGPGYLSADSFMHIENQFLRNPLFWILFFLRFWNFRKVQGESRGDLVLNAILFGIMILSPEKTQFFIACFLPFFAFQAAIVFSDFSQSIYEKRAKIFMLLSLLVSLFTGVRWFDINLQNNNNQAQLATLDGLHKILEANPEVSFYDFTCLIPPSCQKRHFVGPHQKTWNDVALKYLKKDPPQVLLYLRKARFIGPAIAEFIDSEYLHVGNGLFIRRSQNDSSQPALDMALIEKLRSNVANPLDSLFGYDIDY